MIIQYFSEKTVNVHYLDEGDQNMLWEIHRGTDRVIEYQLKNNLVYDLTGKTLSAQIYDQSNVLVKSLAQTAGEIVVTDAVNGIFDIYLSRANYSGLNDEWYSGRILCQSGSLLLYAVSFRLKFGAN